MLPIQRKSKIMKNNKNKSNPCLEFFINYRIGYRGKIRHYSSYVFNEDFKTAIDSFIVYHLPRFIQQFKNTKHKVITIFFIAQDAPDLNSYHTIFEFSYYSGTFKFVDSETIEKERLQNNKPICKKCIK